MLKTTFAVWLGKLILFLTRATKRGGGSAAPGFYALAIEPDLISKLSSQIRQNVVVTGTNGKTTTTRLLAHLLKEQKITVIRNSTGSNLERGVASALIARSNFFGRIKGVDLGIWELDEAAFNKVFFQIKPQITVFLNALRDQLDRYGEVDSVVKNWRTSLEGVNWKATVLLNSGDGNVGNLSAVLNLPIYRFRVRSYRPYQELSDKKPPRQKDDFLATVIEKKGLRGTNLAIKHPTGEVKLFLPVPGIYHIYDLLAAFGVYYLLNLPLGGLSESLKEYHPAFGRVERVNLGGKEAYLFLIKNPAGASLVLETLVTEVEEGDRLLIALNDNFADGTDVSWIWDAEFEQLLAANCHLPIICSGTRAYDLAVRLKYASIKPEKLQLAPNIVTALDQAQEGLSGRLFILPTYTALLELQKILAKRGVKKHYWEEGVDNL